jgi:hypothetical protein
MAIEEVGLITYDKQPNGEHRIRFLPPLSASARVVAADLYALGSQLERWLEALGGTCQVRVAVDASLVGILPLTQADREIAQRLIEIVAEQALAHFKG